MSSREAIVVEVQTKVIRYGAKPESFGWSLTIHPHDAADQVAAQVTEICKRLRDETQGKLK
ncbi:MAG: hypothetical protein ABI414_08800 [Devosia sp.]